MTHSTDGGARSLLKLPTQDPPLPSTLTWDLCYKLITRKDELEVKIDGAVVGKIPNVKEVLGTLNHRVFTSKSAQPAFQVAQTAGLPELCGVVIEADPPRSRASSSTRWASTERA